VSKQTLKELKDRRTEKDRIHHSVFTLIHGTAAAVHDACFGFEVAMTETDLILLMVG